MINCIIVDDEPLALDILEDYIKKVPFLNLSKKCLSSMEAMDILQKEKMDLVFLDIQMPDLTGIELLKTLPQKPDVIFTTAYSDYAIEGFNLDAVDYLLKPISFERFLKAANKYYSNPQHAPSLHEPYLFIKTEYKIVKVNLEDIMYIEGLKDYIRFVTTQDQLLTLQSMKSMEETLAPHRFIRVHKSYIVSLRHIEAIERNKIKIKDKWIPIGNTYRDSFYQILDGKI